MTNQEKLALYTSIFRGRTDAYPRRWEKNGKSGWTPAYAFDWDEFNTHRAHGGTIKDFENKKLLPFTNEVILNHLLGKESIGIYPIRENNTSYFIAADFDEKDWRADSKKLIDVCEKAGLKTYTEVSRSGNGAHVWVFFENEYPCFKSRTIMLELIRQALNYSKFVKEISFDRLFPNQDNITDGGFGNLIALPLQGERVKNNCSTFCDSRTFEPYQNQWEFLEQIHKHTTLELDEIYNRLFSKNEVVTVLQNISGQTTFIMDGSLHLKKSELSPKTTSFIKEKLNLFNKEYGTKKQLGKSVFKTEKYFNLIQDIGDEVILPRGFREELEAYLKIENVSYQMIERYEKFEPTKLKSSITLHSDQKSVLGEIKDATSGVIIAPPGSGKTVIALELIARLGLPALILVNRNQLLSQWVDRIEQFLGVPKIQIGTISGTRKKIGKQITIATFQSVIRYKNLKEITNTFGVIIIDECHHIPAKTYRELIWSFKSKYCFGLTATHERKHGIERITELMIGPVIAEMKQQSELEEKSFDIIIHKTKLTLPFRYKTDHYEILAKAICFDSARNELIARSILKEVKVKRKILVLTERKEHIEILNLYLRGHTETISISGNDSLRSRKLKIAQIHTGNFQVILATGQLIGEGFDLYGADTIILAFPFSFEGKLVQYIGRLRGVGVKHVIDFYDEKVEFLDRQFVKRRKFYEKKLKSKSQEK